VAVETQSQKVNESSRNSSALAALSSADRSMERYDRARLICVCITAVLLGGRALLQIAGVLATLLCKRE
jgi:hypothetical protein